MDFMTHLPQTSRGHDVMWVVMNRLTKSAHFLAWRMTFTLEDFGRLYIQEIVRLHRVPVSIVADRDPRFMANFWESFQRAMGTHVDDEHCFSSLDGRLVRDDHTNFRGHALSMRP